MANYTRDYSYRNIWIKNFGPIPKDELGRSYEIHHIDGNNKNNELDNLRCVSLQEHYDIHFAQGDWYACLRISAKLKMTGSEISELARKNALNRVKKGTHHFVGGDWQRYYFRKPEMREHFRKIALMKISEGTHNMCNGMLANKSNLKRLANGTHNFLGNNNPNSRRLQEGTHNFQQQLKDGSHPKDVVRTCPHCNLTGKGGSMLRWHFDNCKASEKDALKIKKENNKILVCPHCNSSGRNGNMKRYHFDNCPSLSDDNYLKKKSRKKGWDLSGNKSHPTQIVRTCPHCGYEGKGVTMIRWHFDKCKKLLCQ